MRVAVLHPQTAFVRGGAETHAEGLGNGTHAVLALPLERAAGDA